MTAAITRYTLRVRKQFSSNAGSRKTCPELVPRSTNVVRAATDVYSTPGNCQRSVAQNSENMK